SRRTRRAGSPTRTSRWRARSRTPFSGGRSPTVRWTVRWASSCSRNSPFAESPTRGRSRFFQRHVVDALEVEHGALGLEHPLDAALLQLHLRATHGERPELEYGVLLGEIIVAGDTLHSDGLGGRVVDDDPQAVESGPAAAPQDLRTGRAGGEHGNRSGPRSVELVAGGGLDDLKARLLS